MSDIEGKAWIAYNLIHKKIEDYEKKKIKSGSTSTKKCPLSHDEIYLFIDVDESS